VTRQGSVCEGWRFSVLLGWNDEDSHTDEKINQQSGSDQEKPGGEILAARDTEQEKIGQGLAWADDQRLSGTLGTCSSTPDGHN
jgi:hypothetical protein